MSAKAKRTYSLRVRNSPLRDLEFQRNRVANSVTKKNHSHLDMLVEEKSGASLPLPNGDLKQKPRGLSRTFSFQSKFLPNNNNNSDTDSVGSGLVAKNFLRMLSPSPKPTENVEFAEDSHGDIGYAKYPKDREKSRLDIRPVGGSVSTGTIGSSWRSQNSTDSSSPTAPIAPDSNLRNGPHLHLDYGSTTATTPRLSRSVTPTTSSLKEPLRSTGQLNVPKSAPISRSASNLAGKDEEKAVERKIKFDPSMGSDRSRSHKTACRSVSDSRKDLPSEQVEFAEVHRHNLENPEKMDSSQVLLESSKGEG